MRIESTLAVLDIALSCTFVLATLSAHQSPARRPYLNAARATQYA